MLINANGTLVSHVAIGSLGGSLGNSNCKLKKVKSEGTLASCGLSLCMEHHQTSFLT